MKLKSLLFGSAAVLAAGTGAQAADLPTVEPVEYVRICDAFGTGFFYIPGTDTCLRIGGYVRVQSGWINEDGVHDRSNASFNSEIETEEVNTWSSYVRGQVSFDTRTQTDFGLIRAYIALNGTRGFRDNTVDSESDKGVDGYSADFNLDSAYIQVSNDMGTFTTGKYGSFFDFYGGDLYGGRVGLEDGTTSPNLFAYTFAGGNGFSFSISAEDPDSVGRRRNGDASVEGLQLPDGVANIRVDQGWGSAQVMAAVRDTHDEDPGGGAEHGLAFAVGAGLRIGLPGGWSVAGQGGYADGMVAYISNDPGRGGDLDFGDANDTNRSWAARAGVMGPIFTNVTVWANAAYTHWDENSDAFYDWYAFGVGGAWEPAPGLTMGPEFAYNAMRGDNDDNREWDLFSVMWRTQRNF